MKDSFYQGLRKFQWNFLFVGLAVLTALLGLISQAFAIFKGSFYAMLFLTVSFVVFAVITLLAELVKAMKSDQSDLYEFKEAIKASTSLLDQIDQAVKLSETAKKIAYRDLDRRHLRVNVIEKLHQQDFSATYSMIDDIARQPEYRALADELRLTADNYKNATENERSNQVIGYIEKQISQRQWTAAAAQIESLVKRQPDLEEAKNLRKKLVESKELHKRQLLAEWDEAVKKEDTDKSLQILKELDLYLTPSEGLALQEAATQVFKNKLHNLGVQFALAVTEKRWQDAINAAAEIMRNFPNSRMALEVKSKMSILKELAEK